MNIYVSFTILFVLTTLLQASVAGALYNADMAFFDRLSANSETSL